MVNTWSRAYPVRATDTSALLVERMNGFLPCDAQNLGECRMPAIARHTLKLCQNVSDVAKSLLRRGRQC